MLTKEASSDDLFYYLATKDASFVSITKTPAYSKLVVNIT